MTFVPDRLSVAPMMDWTDRHFRFMMRQITRRTLLYTEMVTAQAVVFGDAGRLLAFSPEEKPLILQLGGSDPDLLAKACKIAAPLGFDGINLNAGCPSERVAAGCFGAALRKSPELIAECLSAMIESSNLPVSVKSRIALAEETSDSDGYDNLTDFVEKAEKAGCKNFIIHARKAKLDGFTPKQNRERLPLRYDLVYRLKQDFPTLRISINGNVASLNEAKEHLKYVDGVMIGRAAYATPMMFACADKEIFEDVCDEKKPWDVVLSMENYITRQINEGVRLPDITRHMLGLFRGCPGAARWRRELTQNAVLPNADFKTVALALKNVISSS